jgi:hypothetical protein
MEPFIEGFTKFNSNSGWVNPKQHGWRSLAGTDSIELDVCFV